MSAPLRLCLTMMLYCLALVSGANAAAQQTPESQSVQTKFVVNVNRALVPVVVRDKQGKTNDGVLLELTDGTGGHILPQQQ